MSYKLYDAEIEYLESTGSQYINIGLYETSLITSEVTYKAYGQFNNYGNPIIGCSNSGRAVYYHVSLYNNRYYYGTNGGERNSGNAQYGNKHTIIYNSNDAILNVDGLNVDSFKLKQHGYCNIYIGYRTANAIYSAMLIYEVKIYNKNSPNTPFIHLIPVRVGNVGYMYDKVSGKLFGNAGTGSFVLGPDVAPAAYANEIAFLESTGSQYIDNVYTDNASANEVVFDFQVNGTGDIIGNKDSDSYANGTKIVGITGTGAFAYYKPTGARVLLQLNSGENSLTNIVTTFSKTTSAFTIEADGETLSGAYSGIARNEPYTMLVRDSNLTVGYFVGKIYSGKIYEDGVLVRDFIPVEYNNIGYLYDKVSGQFFANQGTGKFVLGHRAPRFDGKACARSYTRRQLMSFKLPYDAEIEYLESTGTQYIDSGIECTGDLSVECMVRIAELGGENYRRHQGY